MLVKGEPFSADGISRILLIQLGDIGDFVLTTPTMRTLRENCPSSEIFVLVREHVSELVDNCPWVDGLISVNKAKRKLRDELDHQRRFILQLRKKRFQLTIDLRTGTRGAIVSFLSGARARVGRYADNGGLWRNRLFTHLVRPVNELEQYSSLHSLNILEPLQLQIRDISPALEVAPEKRKLAREILSKEGVSLNKPIIVLHPFSRWSYKEWPIQNYIALINHVGSRYPVSFVLTGAHEDTDRAAEILRGGASGIHNLVGKSSLGELSGLLANCSLLIGIDSAAAHIAAAVGTPTVTIFGPSSPVCWAPRGEEHYIVVKDLPCVPCRQKGCNHSGVSRCLQELEVGEVIEVLDKKIAEILERADDD